MTSLLRWTLLAVVVAWAVLQWQERTERRDLAQLRDAVVQARGAATECTRDLAVEEAEFRDLDARVDSLRTAVDTLEALDPRGVPARRYAEYLTVVDAYNDGVERWEEAAESLQAAEDDCRVRVETYNALADSARGRVGPDDSETPSRP